MKILYVGMDFGNNGIASWIKNYSKELLNFECTIDFMTIKPPESKHSTYFENKGCKFYPMPSYSERIPIVSSYLYLVDFFKKKKYDIIHVHHDSMSIIPLLAAKVAGQKVRISHSHTTGDPEGFRKYLYTFFRKGIPNTATKLMSCNKQSVDFFYKNVENVTLINNAIDIDTFSFNIKNRNKLRSEYNISSDKLAIGIIGRLSNVKNHHFFLKLAENSSHNFYIIGDGELYSTIESYIENNNLSNVYLLGNKDNIEMYYSMLDILLMPSLYEGVPYTLIEAQTNGLYSIISDNIDTNVLMTDTIKMLPLSTDLWIEQINLFKQYSRSNQSSNNALKIIENGYGLKNESKKLFKVYEDIFNTTSK